MEKDSKKAILLIDPDVSVTKILSDRLSSIGFNTMAANDEETAFKLIQTGNPDIILLDILMKSKSGNDILTAIKSEHNSQNTPVIILSSAVDVNSKVNGFLSGASDYIVKPFRFAEVLARINNQIRIVNMQHELEKKNKELTEKNILLQQMAVTDGLTGLYNKRYILSRLSGEISHAARYKEPISFLMVDVDHFKKINDTYGHVVGDILLKETAQLLRKLVREFDIIARYGGEEFLVVLPNGDVMGAGILAERLRDSVEKSVFNINGNKILITISIGIGTANLKLNVDSGAEVTKLINQADIALYNAKANGRNRVEVYSDDMNGVEKDNKRDSTVLDQEIHISDGYTH